MTNAEEVVRRALAGKTRRYSAVIVCDGNSLTAGTGSTGGQTYPRQLADLVPDCLVVNAGVGAQSTASMISNSSDVDVYLTSIKPPRIVMAWELRNTMNAGGTPAQAVADMETYCLARRALGARVIVMNVTEDTYPGTGMSDAERLEANSLLAAGYADFADALVDLAARTNLQDSTNLTYFTDGIHMTNAGYAEVAAGALAFVSSRSARALL